MEPLGIGLHHRGAVLQTGAVTACCGPSREPSASAPQDARRVAGGSPSPQGALDGLVAIPAGSFTMGTDDPAGYPADGEGPAHPVDLPAY